MFVKIIIITVILILGIAIFSLEGNNVFTSASSNLMESMKDNANSIGTKAVESVENGYDSSVKIMNENTDKITNQINDVKESSEDLFTKKISKINPQGEVNQIFKNETTHDDPLVLVDPSNPTNNEYTDNTNVYDKSKNYVDSNKIINEKLSLSSIQQSNGDVLLQYFDVTGNTKSANVVIRTSEKEIFSGTFFTSNFKTVINDVSRTPYYMDVIVEHKDYGIIISSIFNSGDSTDYKIIGMFVQS